MDVLTIGIVSLVIVPCAIVAALALATPGRWGASRVAVAAPGGAYRGGATTRVPRRIPPRVAGVSALALAWAAVTGLVLVPAGGALVLVSVDGDRALLALFTGAVVLSGVAHAVALCIAGVGLATRSARAEGWAWSAAAHARAHHAVAFLGFSMAVFALEPEPAALAAVAAVAVPCAIGWGVAAALEAAGRDVAALSPSRVAPPGLADAA